MVYELKKPEDEEQGGEIQGTAGEGVAQPELIGAPKTIEGGGGSTQQEVAPVKAPAAMEGGAGGVTDVGAYLEKNREQARRLAQKVGGVISGDIKEAQEARSGAEQQFIEDVQSGTVQKDEDLFGRAKNVLIDPYAAAGTPPAQPPSQTGAPTGELPPPEQQEPLSLEDFMSQYGDQFGAQYGATYGGPQDIIGQEYYQQARKEAQEALEAARAIETAEGRERLIRRATTTPSGRYSAGVAALDQALLAQEAEAFKTLQEAASPAQDLESQLSALEELAAEKVAEGKGITQATREAYQETFQIGGEEAEIEETYKQIREQAREVARKEEERLEGLAKKEGVSAADYFSDADLLGFSSGGAAQVLRNEDIARLRALEELTGQTSKFIMPEDEEKIGEYEKLLDPESYFLKQQYEDVVAGRKTLREAQEEAQREAEREKRRQQAEAELQAAGVVVGAGAGAALGGPVGAVVGGAIGGAIASVFCFAPETEVEMSDGTNKKIKDIEIGDITRMGGLVTTVSKHINFGDTYVYPTLHGDVFVTGGHAVREDGRWVRVKDSKNHKGMLNDQLEVPVVYSLSNAEHRLIIGGQVFADFQEVDNDHLYNDDECLAILNDEEIRHGTRELTGEIPVGEGRLTVL